MLRSLYSGISGTRAHQTALDVTANNIANVNTVGFKKSSVQFQDTLSQMLSGAGAGSAASGGTNPAQVGLGVQVGAISTSFVQGSAQSTGVGTDLMISGDGFFAVSSGGETLYTRNGSFNFDPTGRLVTADGGLVLGWTAQDGAVNAGAAPGPITLPVDSVSAAAATTSAEFTGNLPSDAKTGDVLIRDLDVFDASGNATKLTVTFTKTDAGWDVGDGTTTGGSLTFTDGVLDGGGALTVGGVDLDLSTVTGYSGINTVALNGQDGNAAGEMKAYSISGDGSIVGTFSNGKTEVVARIALTSFSNPSGLEKVGGSNYRATVNSGTAQVGTAGDPGFGGIEGGQLEMSNVDLSQEFTNLITAQRGFQANARVITTSDSILEELVNLKR